MSAGAGEPCAWQLDPSSNTWDTGCGNAFLIDEGTPQQNHMNFCCFCGNRLEPVGEDSGN